MRWLWRILSADILERRVEVLEKAVASLHHERAKMELDHTRFIRNMVEEFLITQEKGLDIRDLLIAGLRDMDDEIARKSEHLL